jgi:hypothetical protein
MLPPTLDLKLCAREEIDSIALRPQCGESCEAAISMLPLTDGSPESACSFGIRAGFNEPRQSIGVDTRGVNVDPLAQNIQNAQVVFLHPELRSEE